MHRLLTQGQNIQDASEDGESLLSLACSAGYYELAEVLLRMRASVEDRGVKGDSTPLMEAASGGYADIVKLLISHGANVNAKSSAGNTALTYACCGGYEEVVRLLLEAGAEVEHQNENGHTPLMEAASCGHVGVAKLLLDYGANINTHSNEFKESALTLACYKGHLEMVKFLLNAGADQEHKTDEMHTALMEASMDGHVDVARLLLDHGAQVNMPVDSFESPLTLAACGGHYELVALLISRGADLEEVNDEGYTPLMEAAREGHEEVVTLLVEHGAHVNGQTEETQETALTLACCGGFLDVVQYLIEHGSDIELGASTPLMEAAQEGHVEIVKYLIEKGANVHAETSTQDTALTYASANGHTLISDVLVQCGSHLEHECEGGRTPLMKAARAGHIQTVQFLANKGADVNRHTTTNDHTVLSLACSGGHVTTVQYLLGQGANPTHILRDNATMLTEASRGGHMTVANLLLQQQRIRGLAAHPPTATTTSSITGSRGGGREHHYDRLKLRKKGGGGGSGAHHHHHHHHHHQGHPSSSAHPPSSATAPAKTHKVTSTTAPDAKPQRKTQASLASDTGAGGPAESVGSAKRQKISDDSSNKHHQPSTADLGGGSIPPRNIPRQGTNNSKGPSESTKPPSHPPSSTGHPQQSSTPPPPSSFSNPGQQQALPEDVLVRCMLQMAQQQQQQQAAGVRPSPPPSASAAVPVSTAGDSATTTGDWSSTAAASSPTNSQRDPKSSTGLGSPNSLFSRGNFAPLDHLPPSLSSSSSSLSSGQPPPKFQSHGKIATTVATSGTITSSAPTMTSSTTTPLPQLSAAVPGATFSSADLSRLIPHLEAIAGSLQNSPSLESHCLAALAQTHLLPTLAGYDPNSPQTAQVLEALQSLPLVGDSKNAAPLPNASGGGDLASFLAGLDMNTLMQNLTGQELPGFEQADAHTQSVTAYIGEGGAGRRSQRSVGGDGEGARSKVEAEMHPSRPRPLTTSFLLDHNFPMDIPPPTDLLPEHLPLPSGYVPTVENESYLSSEEDDLEDEEGSDTSYLAQEIGLPPGSYDPAIEIDQQTDSNHDTALTLAAAGGHDELVELLISHGANIEHRDKKGCTPLILAASAGHAVVVAILLDHTADIESQSDRTKDTALSLACSGGRQEVVEILLAKGANFEHRNVSDYTPLSLAASGGYVTIIKMLLRAGADINSRTGSKLGITPLMLAAMNGHTATVKLLLDMGSDINAQIETNRNTALTLACFQGRHEVVSLLVERQANVEHRAKTGLTPLMEAASGGYHEVGRVLINKGADVNAAPVPSSRDTALTIAADKGHYRFVDLILREGAHVDVKNKKGNSPLWLAANGGHLDVVKLLVDHGSDLDSQDNRKVSCLMAAFRKGHFKVVKYLVDHVSQFPSDADLTRYVSTLSDKESLKKCQRCMEVIIDAKERQAAEANKNATILLQEIDQEKKHEEDKKAAAARKRAKKKRQKEKKQALKAQKGDKVGEKGGGDSPPEVDQADDAADDVMAENGEIHEELSPVDRIPPKEPLPLVLPLAKKPSPVEREKAGGEGNRGYSRVTRLPSTGSVSSMSLSPGGVASPGGTTPTSSPRKAKKEDGWKEVGKRTKKVSVPGSVFAAVVGKNNSNLHLIKQATNTHIEVERTSKTASTRALSVRGSTEAIKQAQHIISLLVKDPSHNIANVLQKHPPQPSLHQVTGAHGHKPPPAPQDHTVTTNSAALPHSSLLGDHRVPLSASLSLASSSLPPSTSRTALPKRSSVPTAVSTVVVTRASTVNALPITSVRMGKTLGDKRHSLPQSVLALTDLKTAVGGAVSTTQTRVAASVVSSAATVRFSMPLTPNSGPVRRLFTTTTIHSGTTQTIAVVSVAQTTALPSSTLAPGGFVQPVGSMVPPPPRVPSVATVVGPQPGKPIQPPSPTLTNVNKTLPSHTDHYGSVSAKTEPAPTTNTYSRAIGSHLTNQVSATSSLIEQPLQQIMKTPTIFQEPAMQLTKPKKYSDAVGKKMHEAVAHSSGNCLATAGAPSVVPPPLPHPTLSLPPSLPPTFSLPSSLSSSLPSSLPHPSIVHTLNLAPGSRPIMTDDKTQAASMFSQSQLTDRFTGAVWLDSDRNIADHHRQPYDGEDRLPPTASSLGPIGPPNKIPKPPIVGAPPKSVSTSSVGGRGEIGPPGRGSDAGGRFSPIGSRGGIRTSPSGGGVVNVSPQQRSSDPSPVAKSPLLGPAPPGGLLPTPEKLYTSNVGFRPIQPQSSSSQPDFSLASSERVPDVLPLTPTPVRNPRPPLLATPPGFPPPFLPQGMHQSPIHPTKQAQKPASPVQPVNTSPDKISPNKSPPQLPPVSKGFNPNAPTFVPMGLPGVQRPANPPPTCSILGAPPISKLTNFPPPPVGSSILGSAPPIGGGPRMVGPNIHPTQPPQPPPSGGQTSILGQPPTPPINPHIFNPPPALPPGQQSFPPKPPSQPMFGQFEGTQTAHGVLQPPMPPFGIIFPGNPQHQQNFVGQPSQNFTSTKDFLPGPLEGGQFLPNPISQQIMLNQGGPPPGGSSEISRFGVPLMKVGKSDPDSADPILGVTTGGTNIPLPPMMISTESGGSFEATPSHPQLVRPGNVFGMGLHPSQPGLRPVPEPAPPTSSGSILGNFSGGNLDLFPTFLPMSDRSSVPPSTGPMTTNSYPAAIMMVRPSVFPSAPPTTTGSAPQEQLGGANESLLPIGTERAHKGAGLGGVASGSGSTSVSTDSGSSFPMLAPGINPSSVWSYSGSTGSHEESDWSKQVGGASVTSDPHRWPDSVKTSQQSRNSNDITITSQDTLQSLLARVGLTEHMELFQSNEIDLEALLLMSDKDFSEIGLPQAAQTTLMNSLGRGTSSAVREEGVASSATDQGDGRGFPSGSRQQEDSL